MNQQRFKEALLACAGNLIGILGGGALVLGYYAGSAAWLLGLVCALVGLVFTMLAFE